MKARKTDLMRDWCIEHHALRYGGYVFGFFVALTLWLH
jgi:hypothetical protein